MPDRFEQLRENIEGKMLRDSYGPTYYNRRGEPLTDVLEWAEWMSDEKFEENRRVGMDRFYGTEVSTVCLGLDHSFTRDGPPIIFETMTFTADGSEECWRYHTEAEAMRGHRVALGRMAWPHRLAAVLSIVAVLVALVVMAGA